MPPRRVALLLAAMMFAAAAGAFLAQPTTKLASMREQAPLEVTIPKQFGEWREVSLGRVEVVNPQTQEILDRLYSEVLSRLYVNAAGDRIMLSLAYGSDQRGALQAHKPEVCYPAQGFVVHRNEPASVATAYGNIPVRRLLTSKGTRHEPVTYWFTVGERAVEGVLQKRIEQMRLGLTGRIPDGMLFRVSSIDRNQVRANDLHDRFVNDLLNTVSARDRRRLSGLDAPPAASDKASRADGRDKPRSSHAGSKGLPGRPL